MEVSFTKPSVIFEVEKVIGVSSEGNYQVQWAPAWVSRFHLIGCEHLIQEFYQQQADTGDASMLTVGSNNATVGDSSHVIRATYAESDPSHSCHIDSPTASFEDRQFESSNENEELKIDISNVAIKFEEDEFAMHKEPSSALFRAGDETWNKKDGSINNIEVNNLAPAYGKESRSSLDISRSTELQDASAVNTEDRKNYECEVCGKQFDNKSSHTLHLRTHTGYKPYTCQHCNKSFTQSSNLKRHLRIHNGEKLFACSECDKAFSDKSNLRNHLQTHTGEKPFGCSSCGKAFTRKDTLERHLQVHTGVKPYACHLCEKKYSDKRRLEIHVNGHLEGQDRCLTPSYH